MAEKHRRAQAQETLEGARNTRRASASTTQDSAAVASAIRAQALATEAQAHAAIYLADEVKALREAFEDAGGDGVAALRDVVDEVKALRDMLPLDGTGTATIAIRDAR